MSEIVGCSAVMYVGVGLQVVDVTQGVVRAISNIFRSGVDGLVISTRDGHGLGPSMGWVGLGRIFQHM